MEIIPRHKITKGKFGGVEFLYNPTEMTDSRPINYTAVQTCGMSYPVPVYGGGGQRELTFDLYLNDQVKDGITKKFIKRIRKYLPKKKKKGYQFDAPEPVRLTFGWLVVEGYLSQMDVNYTAFSPKLQPIEATVTITLQIIQ